MNLVMRVLRAGIEGIPYAEFEQVLYNQHRGIAIRKTVPGLILLSNNQVIQCVRDYYRHRDTPPGTKKLTNDCWQTYKALDIRGVSTFDCKACHLAALELKKYKELIGK